MLRRSGTGVARRLNQTENGSFRRPRRSFRWVGAKSADRDLLLPKTAAVVLELIGVVHAVGEVVLARGGIGGTWLRKVAIEDLGARFVVEDVHDEVALGQGEAVGPAVGGRTLGHEVRAV